MTINKRDIQRFIKVFISAEIILATITYLFIKFLKAKDSNSTVSEIWIWIAACMIFGGIIALAALLLTHSKEDIRKGFLSVFLIMAVIGIVVSMMMIFVLDHISPEDPWVEIEPVSSLKVLSFVKDRGICGGDICICVNTEKGDIYCSVEPYKGWEKLTEKRIQSLHNYILCKKVQEMHYSTPSKPKGKIIDAYDYTICFSDGSKKQLNFILMEDGRILYWKKLKEQIYYIMGYFIFGIIGFIIAALSSLALRFERMG